MLYSEERGKVICFIEEDMVLCSMETKKSGDKVWIAKKNGEVLDRFKTMAGWYLKYGQSKEQRKIYEALLKKKAVA